MTAEAFSRDDFAIAHIPTFSVVAGAKAGQQVRRQIEEPFVRVAHSGLLGMASANHQPGSENSCRLKLRDLLVA